MKGYKKRQKGIGLIEVLIAAVVFALGSLAVVQLQGKFFKSSSASNARSVAMSIAQDKLEDLRGVASTKGGFVTITANAGGRLCVAEDLPDTGVACTAGVLSRPTGNIAKNNALYTRTWAVANSYYDTAGTLLSQASCTTSSICGPSNTSVPATPDQKNITVTIAWTDTDGSAQTVVFDGLINANSTSSGGTILADTGGSGESPSVPYTPSTDIDVTPIQVGADSKRETLVPLSSTVDGYTRTLFTAYTYNSDNKIVRQEEFQNVACLCKFDGNSTVANPTYTVAHPEWSSTKDTYIDVEGDLVGGKVKGCVKGGGSNCKANPEPLCNICCRDHHDISSAAQKYDPYRDVNDITGGDHNHYYGTNVVLASSGGEYLESCRLKRVNGYWRVFQDWNLVNFKVLPETDLADSTIKSTYAGYVNDIIDTYLGDTATPIPSSLVHTDSSNDVEMSVNNRSNLSGRAVYLDYMNADHLSAVTLKKGASQDYLLHVPFYEISVTEVTNWLSGDIASLEVGPYDDGTASTANDLEAGEMNALATSTSAVSVTGNIRISNSALTALTQSIDYYNISDETDNSDDVSVNDNVSICIGCSSSSGSCNAPWGAIVAADSSIQAFLSRSVTAPATCASQSRVCTSGTLSGSYLYASCAITTPTCDTTVKGFSASGADTVTLNDGTTDHACTVTATGGGKYNCPTVTTALDAIITVRSTVAGVTNTLATICGTKTVNF